MRVINVHGHDEIVEPWLHVGHHFLVLGRECENVGVAVWTGVGCDCGEGVWVGDGGGDGVLVWVGARLSGGALFTTIMEGVHDASL